MLTIRRAQFHRLPVLLRAMNAKVLSPALRAYLFVHL